MEDIMVSINCITYNHEQYIAEAIESFLMQKTNFGFEILIHDDASTDGTQAIIRSYANKYPDIIKPVLQVENQLSKGITRIDHIYNATRAKGEYIAICEGDDYWTDPYKLQKQVDYMERHTECSMCVHAAYKVSHDGKKLGLTIRPGRINKIFTVEDVIRGGGDFIATNSILYRTKLIKNVPDFYINAPVGDYPTAIYLALKGEVYYIDKFMSVYRTGVKGSFTDTEFLNTQKRINHYKKIAKMLDQINLYTNYRYDKVINKTKQSSQFYLLIGQGLFNEAKMEYREVYSELNFKDRLYILMKQFCPNIQEALFIIKRYMRKISLTFMERADTLRVNLIS